MYFVIWIFQSESLIHHYNIQFENQINKKIRNINSKKQLNSINNLIDQIKVTRPPHPSIYRPAMTSKAQQQQIGISSMPQSIIQNGKSIGGNKPIESSPPVPDFYEDDDFGDVDEYEEGDANNHKKQDALLLQAHPTGLRLQDKKQENGNKKAALVVNSFQKQTTALQKKNSHANLSSRNFRKGQIGAFLNSSASVSQMNNISEISGGDPLRTAAPKHYIPRQKSKSRIANNNIMGSMTTAAGNTTSHHKQIMNRTFNNDDLVNPIANNDGTQLNTEMNEATTKQEESSMNLNVSQQVSRFLNNKQSIHEQIIPEKVPKREVASIERTNMPTPINDGGAQSRKLGSIQYAPPARNNLKGKLGGKLSTSMTQKDLRLSSFDKAYERLVSELAGVNGANLLVPKQDMIIKETQDIQGKPIINVDKSVELRQQSIMEFQRKKQERIQRAKAENQRKEMQECTFQPRLVTTMDYRRSSQQKADIVNVQDVDFNAADGGGAAADENGNRAVGSAQQVRGFEQFLNDQKKFLEAQKMKRDQEIVRMEEITKRELNLKKINKKSENLLKKRQERIENRNLNTDLQKEQANQQDADMQGETQPLHEIDASRFKMSKIPIVRVKKNQFQNFDLDNIIKKPSKTRPQSRRTSLSKESREANAKRSRNRKTDRSLQQARSIQGRQAKIMEVKEQLLKYSQKIDKLQVQNRDPQIQREAAQQMRSQERHQSTDSFQTRVLKSSDKYLIIKFNKEFDRAKELFYGGSDNSNSQQMPLDTVRNRQKQIKDKYMAAEDQATKLDTINENGPEKVPSKKGNAMTKEQVKELLQKLGMIKERENIESMREEEYLFADFWHQLRPEINNQYKHECVYSENVKLMLQIIIRLIDSKRVCEPIDESINEWKAVSISSMNREQPSRKSFGYFDRDGLLYIKPNDVAVIQSQFDLFFVNRFTYYKELVDDRKNDRKVSQDIIQENPIYFKPQLGQNSQMLGEEKRRKMLREMGIDESQINDYINDVHKLLPLLRNHSQAKWHSMTRQAQDEEFRKKHTFTPNTKLTKGLVKPKKHQPFKNLNNVTSLGTTINLQGHREKRPSVTNDTSQLQGSPPIHDELYNLRKRIIDQHDRSMDDFDYEKSEKELTFRPKIGERPQHKPEPLFREVLPSSPTSSKAQPMINIVVQSSGRPVSSSHQLRQQKSQQKIVERMRGARTEKLRKDNFLKIGERLPQDGSTVTHKQPPRSPTNTGKTALGMKPPLNTKATVPNSIRIDLKSSKKPQDSRKKSTDRLIQPKAIAMVPEEEATFEGVSGNLSNVKQYLEESNSAADPGAGPATLEQSRKNSVKTELRESTPQEYEQIITVVQDLSESGKQQQEPDQVIQEFQVDGTGDNKEPLAEVFIQDQQDAGRKNMDLEIQQEQPLREDDLEKEQKKGEGNNELKQEQESKDNKEPAKDDEIDDADLDSLDSETQEAGVPNTKMSDIRDAIETNQSRQNQFSTKTMSIRGDYQFEDKDSQMLENSSPPQMIVEVTSPVMIENPYKDAEEKESSMKDSSVNSVIVVKSDFKSANSNQQSSNTNTSIITPLLFVDVNIGMDKQERIVIYEGDTPSQVAHNFCQEHKLDSDMLEQLTVMLTQQMSSILQKVEEHDQEDSKSESNKEDINEKEANEQEKCCDTSEQRANNLPRAAHNSSNKSPK